MIGKAEEHEIILAEVPFQNIKGKKWRPVYILQFDDEQMYVYKITTKYHNKSDFIKSKYFEIIDWLKAGLREPSWIDTINIIPINSGNAKIRIIGRLTVEDRMRLIAFLSSGAGEL